MPIRLGSTIAALADTLRRRPRVVEFAWYMSLLGAVALPFVIYPILAADAEVYDDIVVGYTTWFDVYKSIDYRMALAVFIGALIAGSSSLVLFSLLAHKFALSSARSTSSGSALARRSRGWAAVIIARCRKFYPLGIVLSFPTALGTLWLFAPMADSHLTVAAVTVVAVSSTLWFYGKGALQHGDVIAAFVPPLLTFAAIVAFLVFAAFVRGSPIEPEAMQDAAGYALYCSAGALLVTLFFAWRKQRTSLARFILLLQIPLPLLLFKYATFFYDTAVGPLSVAPKIPVLLIFMGLIGILVALNAAHALLRWHSAPTVPAAESALGLSAMLSYLSFPTALSLVAACAFRVPAASGFALDDFHLGEILIPWQQIVDFHKAPYREFVSVQGLLGFGYGAINALFFDGTLRSFPAAQIWLILPVLCFTVLAAYCTFGPLASLLFFLIPLPPSDRLYLVTGMLITLCHPKLLQRPLPWCALATVLITVLLLWNPSTGAALGLPVAVWGIILLRRGWAEKKAARCGDSALWIFDREDLLALGLIVATLGLNFDLLAGVLTFIRENGSTNTIAYGISLFVKQTAPGWFLPDFPLPQLRYPLFEIIRIGGWIITALYAAKIFLRTFLQKTATSPGIAANTAATQLRFFCSVLPIFLVLMLPYSLGRVDATYLSRSGALSVWALGIMLPLAALLCTRAKISRLPGPVVAALIAGGAALSGFDYRTLGQLGSVRTVVPHDYRFVDGEPLGLPRLGAWFIPPDRHAELLAVAESLGSSSHTRESYLDLTNRSAYFFLLDRPSASPYSADYLAANAAVQQRVIAQLEKEQPGQVWLAPRIPLDLSSAALRSYRIYRWLMQQPYRFRDDGFVRILEHAPEGPPLLVSRLPRELRAIFAQSDLKALPSAWGRSWKTLSRRFSASAEAAMPTTYSGIAPKGDLWRLEASTVRLSFDLARFDGLNCEFLLLSVPRAALKPTLKVTLLWRASDQTRGLEPITFELRAAHGLIPMAIDPAWLGSRRLGSLDITIGSARRGHLWQPPTIQCQRLIE